MIQQIRESGKIDPEIGKTYECGTITRRLPRKGVNRAKIYEFICSRCGGLGQARLTQMKSGYRKTCTCGERSAMRTYLAKKASNVGPVTGAALFADFLSGMSFQTLQKTYAITSRYVLSHVLKRERLKLQSSIPAEVIEAHRSELVNGTPGAKVQASLAQIASIPEVLAGYLLRWSLKILGTATAEPVQQPAEVAEPSLSSIGKISLSITTASLFDTALEIMNGVRSDWRKSFTPAELTIHKGGRLSGPAAFIAELNRNHLPERFQPLADFPYVLEATRRHRQEIRRDQNARWISRKTAAKEKSIPSEPILASVLPRSQRPKFNAYPIFAPAPVMEFA